MKQRKSIFEKIFKKTNVVSEIGASEVRTASS